MISLHSQIDDHGIALMTAIIVMVMVVSNTHMFNIHAFSLSQLWQFIVPGIVIK